MSDPIEFFFECDNEVIRLPVNPERLTVVRAGNNRRAEIVALGGVNVLRGVKLKSVALEFYLPGAGGPYADAEARPPEELLAFFADAQERGRPLRMAVSGLGVNLPVSIESLEPTRRAGDHESIAVRMSLLEYRPFAARTAVIEQDEFPVTGPPPRVDDRDVPIFCVVQAGETLWSIARKYLGDGGRYMEIARLNGIANPNHLAPGRVLTLPKEGFKWSCR